MWKEGELTELLIEGQNIQKTLSDSKSIKTIAELAKKCKNYMKKDHDNAALKLLTNNIKDGILPLNNETLKQFERKTSEIRKCQERRFTDRCSTESPPNHVCRYRRGNDKSCHQNKRRI